MSPSGPIDLSKVWLFSGCSKGELRAIETKVKEVDLDAGTLVLDEGSVGQACYVIVEGKVEVLQHNQRIAELVQGEIFGEVALIDRLPRTASVKTLTDSVLLELTQSDFEAVLAASPNTTRKLLTTLAGRLRMADARATY
jgi:CRP-like cAMP-binding protein